MAMAPFAGGGSMNPVDFKQKVISNVEHVIDRINGIAPQYFSEEVSQCLQSYNNTEARASNDAECLCHKMSKNACCLC